MNGRPLRFLALVVGGWVGVRAVLLWPAAPLPVAGLPAAVAISVPVAVPPLAPNRRGGPIARARKANVEAPPVPATRAAMSPSTPSSPPVTLRNTGSRDIPSMSGVAVPVTPARASDDRRMPPPLTPGMRTAAPQLWWGSGWAIGRGGDAGALAGGQLGGSQAGVRIGRTLDAAGRVAAVLRVSAPFAGRGQEAAPGIEWRLPGTPVRLIAERRIAIDGGRGGAALLATAGLPPMRLAGLTLEGYGQAGAVERFGAFADGAARLTRGVDGGAGVRVDAGIGLWGGAQRDAARLDAGPSVGVVVPVGGDRRVRMTLDWRARIAGRAAPGSGPALSIGSDF